MGTLLELDNSYLLKSYAYELSNGPATIYVDGVEVANIAYQAICEYPYFEWLLRNRSTRDILSWPTADIEGHEMF